jgi:protein-S-isoprenylcysteine O-methyltransferase Ste14
MAPSPRADSRWSLALRNVAFTLVVPGLGGVYVPWLILTRHGATLTPAAWYAIAVIAAGVVLYVACVWRFQSTGRGTPGVWDPPRTVVAVGPYRWVRNPIYLSALLIVGGEAWLFLSADLLLYAAALALAFHLIVVGYEEPRLRARFGEQYESYTRAVSRWVPRRPRRPA